MHWAEIAEPLTEAERLLESGLARIHKHLQSGGSLGIMSAATPDNDQNANDDAHRRLIKRFREHGYGPIQATGRAQWGPERSVVVPNARVEDMKKLGDEFKQQAVVHVPAGGKKPANLHFLQASGADAGTSKDIGPEHFNSPNPKSGITILKGLGYNPKDTQTPTRSFTFGRKNQQGQWVDAQGNLIEALTVPPGGQFNPLEKPYVEEVS